jgi:hypothetical protein
MSTVVSRYDLAKITENWFKKASSSRTKSETRVPVEQIASTYNVVNIPNCDEFLKFCNSIKDTNNTVSIPLLRFFFGNTIKYSAAIARFVQEKPEDSYDLEQNFSELVNHFISIIYTVDITKLDLDKRCFSFIADPRFDSSFILKLVYLIESVDLEEDHYKKIFFHNLICLSFYHRNFAKLLNEVLHDFALNPESELPITLNDKVNTISDFTSERMKNNRDLLVLNFFISRNISPNPSGYSSELDFVTNGFNKHFSNIFGYRAESLEDSKNSFSNFLSILNENDLINGLTLMLRLGSDSTNVQLLEELLIEVSNSIFFSRNKAFDTVLNFFTNHSSNPNLLVRLLVTLSNDYETAYNKFEEFFNENITDETLPKYLMLLIAFYQNSGVENPILTKKLFDKIVSIFEQKLDFWMEVLENDLERSEYAAGNIVKILKSINRFLSDAKKSNSTTLKDRVEFLYDKIIDSPVIVKIFSNLPKISYNEVSLLSAELKTLYFYSTNPSKCVELSQQLLLMLEAEFLKENNFNIVHSKFIANLFFDIGKDVDNQNDSYDKFLDFLNKLIANLSDKSSNNYSEKLAFLEFCLDQFREKCLKVELAKGSNSERISIFEKFLLDSLNKFDSKFDSKLENIFSDITRAKFNNKMSSEQKLIESLFLCQENEVDSFIDAIFRSKKHFPVKSKEYQNSMLEIIESMVNYSNRPEFINNPKVPKILNKFKTKLFAGIPAEYHKYFELAWMIQIN